MARLSGMLTGRLANPVYGPALGQNIQGGYQGIADAIRDNKRKRMLDSQLAMLQNADPRDPNVQRSVMDVSRQMGGDPLEAQQLITHHEQQQRQREQADRAAEAQQMARARHQMAKDVHDYNTGIRNLETQERNVVTAAIGKYNGSPESAELIIDAAPTVHQQAVREAIIKQESYKETMAKVAEDRKSREPISEDTLQLMAKTPGMDKAIEVYKSNPTEPGAKGALISHYNAAHQASLYSTAKETPLRQWEVEFAEQLIDNADGGPWPWTGVNISSDVKKSMALEVARRMRDPAWEPTAENILKLLNEAPTVEEEAEPVVINSEQEYNELPIGTKYTWNGKEYTKE